MNKWFYNFKAKIIFSHKPQSLSSNGHVNVCQYYRKEIILDTGEEKGREVVRVGLAGRLISMYLTISA